MSAVENGGSGGVGFIGAVHPLSESIDDAASYLRSAWVVHYVSSSALGLGAFDVSSALQ